MWRRRRSCCLSTIPLTSATRTSVSSSTDYANCFPMRRCRSGSSCGPGSGSPPPQPSTRIRKVSVRLNQGPKRCDPDGVQGGLGRGKKGGVVSDWRLSTWSPEVTTPALRALELYAVLVWIAHEEAIDPFNL